jgi:short-subunit dehydrogenase
MIGRTCYLFITMVVLIYAPCFLDSKNRKRGLIINMSSFGGIMTCPMLATYAASKSFLISWSKALTEELKPSGVMVQCFTPSFVVCL